MDVVWSVLQVPGQHSDTRAIILSSPKNTFFSPVGPEDVLLEDSQGERVREPLQDHLSVLSIQSGTLDLISERE